MRKNNPNRKVVIMGGGLSGLAAAYELTKADYRVEIFEKERQLGGLAKTIPVKGYRFDTGPHRWYTKSDLVNKWMLNLLKGEIVRVPRLTRIYFDKKFFHYPIKMMNAFVGIGPLKAIKAMIDYLYARISFKLRRPNLTTMEDGYIMQFGKTLYETFFKRYSEKLWGRDCRQISIDWVGQRTRGLNIMTILRDALFKSNNIVSLVDEFSYPKKGIGRLAEKMLEEIKKRGGKVYTNAEVVSINHTKDKINSIEVKSGKNTNRIGSDYFISSIPLSDLIKRSVPKLPVEINDLSKKLEYRDEVQVVLFINKEHITPDTWIYVHPKEIPYMRIMEMDNWSDQLSPKGKTAIVFELACDKGDHIWNKNDKDLIKLVTDSFINEFALIDKKDVLGGYIHRVEKEYPVYHLKYKEDTDIIKEFIKRYDNLQIIGRNGVFRYNNMDHSIEMGLYAAWNIIKGKHIYDIESINIEREYLEEKRIENIEDETLDES